MKARVISGSDNIGSVIKLKYSNGFTIGKTIISNTHIASIELVTNKGGGKSIVGALGWSTIGGLTLLKYQERQKQTYLIFLTN